MLADRAVKTLAVTALLIGLASPAFAECKPSKWGDKYEIGSANTVNADRIKLATKLVKKGKAHHLGIVIDRNLPAFPPRSLSVTVLTPNQMWGNRPFPNGMVYNDDIFTGWLGIGSQIDGLGHIGHSGANGKVEFYNCLKGPEVVKTTGLTKFGIEKIPPLVARGVVLDMAGHLGVKNMKAGQFFTAADVEAVAKKQGVTIGEGDVVLFHTGWTDHVLPSDPKAWGSGEPGMAEDVAVAMAKKGVLAVGADTWGVDVIPPQKKGRPFQGHITLIKDNGIYILEVMDTGPLVRDKAWEFMFVLGPSRLRGAVQAIVDPVALY